MDSSSIRKILAETHEVLTTKTILDLGLELLGMHHADRIKKKTSQQVLIFTKNYGPHPFHVARVWRDLLTTDLPDGHVPPEKARFGHFLICLNWLRKYKEERDNALQFKVDEKTIREWNWYFVDKINALKAKKIVWPEDKDWKTAFIVSLDGTAFKIEEPFDPLMRKNRKWYSKKTGGATINAEIAIHLWTNQVVWAYCSGAAGVTNDLGVYKQKLQAMIPAGKKIIVDKGHRLKEDPALCTASSLDNPTVRDFKNRARTRHEKLNGMLKNYKCLKNTFRHTAGKFEKCFNAVVTLVQYELDEDNPQKYRKFLIDV